MIETVIPFFEDTHITILLENIFDLKENYSNSQ